MFKSFRLSASQLRNLAMVFMLIDHTGGYLFPDQMLFRYIGRLAFPIFAFLITEGYAHTRSLTKYMLRLLALAIITDLPYQFMREQNWVYDPFENVIWTFLIGLGTIFLMDKVKEKLKRPHYIAVSLLIFAASYWLAGELSTDYYGLGVTTMVGFHLCRGKGSRQKWGQLATLVVVNLLLANIHRLHFITPETFPLYWAKYGWKLFSPQYYALLALPLIWSYSGQAGYQSKPLKTFNYLFYPLHMLVIGVIKIFYF